LFRCGVNCQKVGLGARHRIVNIVAEAQSLRHNTIHCPRSINQPINQSNLLLEEKDKEKEKEKKRGTSGREYAQIWVWESEGT